jgi:hypothetical protein
MTFLKKLFGKNRNNSHVGPILYSLYEQVDHSNRAAFKKFLSQAPSGCELTATYKNVPAKHAETILTAFQQSGLPGPGVIGAQVFGSNFVIYLKGDFPDDGLLQLTQMFTDSGDRFGWEVEVVSGCFDSSKLRELP